MTWQRHRQLCWLFAVLAGISFGFFLCAPVARVFESQDSIGFLVGILSCWLADMHRKHWRVNLLLARAVLGLPVVVSEQVPPDQVLFVQDHHLVGRIKNIRNGWWVN